MRIIGFFTLLLVPLSGLVGCNDPPTNPAGLLTPQPRLLIVKVSTQGETVALLGEVRIVQETEDTFLAEFSVFRSKREYRQFYENRSLLESRIQEWADKEQMDVTEIRYTHEKLPSARFVARTTKK